MINVNHNVTLIEASREEWQKIESGETNFILRDTQSPYDTTAFMVLDADTGEHLGNAFILSETTFGGWESSPWTWLMFATLTRMTVRELKERFPDEAKMKNPSACEMYLYEIKPISDKELLQRLCDK
jgi:hypothetical protein|nr:MAG TPA: hypothetical protein [Caudoviricetes sp.]